MKNKPLIKGFAILKKLKKDDTEFVFSSHKYNEVIENLIKYPKKRLLGFIIVEFEINQENKIKYSNELSAIDFLKQAQDRLRKKALRIAMLN